MFARTLKKPEGGLAFPTQSLVYITIGISLINVLYPSRLVSKELIQRKHQVTLKYSYEQARLNLFRTVTNFALVIIIIQGL